MIINSRTISSLLLTAVLLFSSIPLAFGGSADTSVSVLNAKPLFLRYWIDGQGPVEYESDGTFDGDLQNGDFYFMKDSSGDPMPYDSTYKDDPSRYIIDIEPPVEEYRDVEIKVEIQDANGWDDLTETEVTALLNVDELVSLAPPAITLVYDSNPSVDRAIYAGSFRLYKETAAGRWCISFHFSDTDKGSGWYNTHMGGFYDSEVIAISLYDSISTDPASTFSFGSIDPGDSGSSTMYVQNDGNTNLGVTVSPGNMEGVASGIPDILYPETSGATNSDTTVGTTNPDRSGYFTVEQPTPIDWNSFIYYRGQADYGVFVEYGTNADTYEGVIVVTPEAIA